MDAGYRIELLGGVRLLQAGRTITRFKTTKNGSLLAFLAINRGRPQFRDAITERFWPDIEPDAARNSFRVALSSLRKQVEPTGVPPNSILRSDRLQVSLNPDAFTTDVEDFESAIRAEQRCPEDDMSGDRLQLLQHAVELYSGDLMAGWYEDWILPERTRLNDMYLGALRRLMRIYAEKQDYDRAIDCGRRAVVSDPLREEWHRSLMRLYRVQGRPAMAVKQFQELERVLKEELGSQPTPQTIELARQCAAGLTRLPSSDGTGMVSEVEEEPDAEAPTRDTSSPSSASAARTGGVLPAIVTRFFGRELELQEVVALLSPIVAADTEDTGAMPATRLLTLTGISGTGKTRLALEAASRLRQIYDRRVWYVSVEEASEANHILERIVFTLNLPPAADSSLLERIVGFLQGPPVLLLLDNFEQVAEVGVPVISQLLDQLPGLVLLITSQLRLGIGPEREFPVAPLQLPSEDADLESLLESPLIALFIDRAQAARPDFQLTARNSAAVAALCNRLEGVPLAIELAAAWAQVLTPAQMLERMSDRFDLLVSTRKSSTDRRRTLRKAIDWSCSLLSEELRSFLGKLSVFAGSWTGDAASAITGEPHAEQWLWQLRQRSLIRSFEAEEEMQFSMLETVRVYLRDQMESQELAQLLAGHAAYYLQFAESSGAHLTGPDASEVALKLELDHTNIRAAMSLASQERSRVPLLRAASAVWRFWYVRGHFQEGINILSRALSDMDTARLLGEAGDEPASTIDSLRVVALQAVARLSYAIGRPAEARTYCQEGLRTAEKAGNFRATTLLRATLLLGYEHSARDVASSEAIAKLGEDAAESLLKQADRPAAALLLNRCAGLYTQSGHLDAALRASEQEVAIRREIQDRPGELEALETAAQLRDKLNIDQDPSALIKIRELEEQVEIAERIAASYAELGVVAGLQGDYPDAREQLENSLVTQKEDDDSLAVWWISEALARTALGQNDLSAAAGWLTQLAGEYAARHDLAGQKSTFALFAELAARIGRSEMAAIFSGLGGVEPITDALHASQDLIGKQRWDDIVARAASGAISYDSASAMACTLASDVQNPL